MQEATQISSRSSSNWYTSNTLLIRQEGGELVAEFLSTKTINDES